MYTVVIYLTAYKPYVVEGKLCEALLNAQVLEDDGPYITIVSIIFNMKFGFFIKKKSHTYTNACFNRVVFGLFSVRTSNIMLQLLPDVVTFDDGISFLNFSIHVKNAKNIKICIFSENPFWDDLFLFWKYVFGYSPFQTILA